MKTNNIIFSEYESPNVEIIDVIVEKGFAASSELEGDIEDMPWG